MGVCVPMAVGKRGTAGTNRRIAFTLMSETIKKILYVANYLLEKDIAGRSFQVFSDDIFLVSYPKSGNTWTRFLLGNLMNPHEGITFANVERKMWPFLPILMTGRKETFPTIFRSTLI